MARHYRIVFKNILKSTMRLITKLWRLCRVSQCRGILLGCNSLTMVEHLLDFYNLFKDDSRLQFRVVFWEYSDRPGEGERMREVMPIPEIDLHWALVKLWDIFVIADYCFKGLLDMRNFPSVYIGHGSDGKSVDGENSLTNIKLAFDRKGRSILSRMFYSREIDRDYTVRKEPRLKDIITVVGNLQHDNLLAQAESRNEFRCQLGFKSSDTVLFVLSTFGPDSLFQTIGDAFLEQSRQLLGEFHFILSIHPNEYCSRAPGQRVWGEYLRSQREFGFLVREPSESWIPYMVACDIVLTDHTSLCDAAALLEKPVIFVPVREELIWKGSIRWNLLQFAPVLKDVRKLRECLLKAKDDYPLEKLHELAKTINPHPGEAAERIRKEIYDLLKIPPLSPNSNLLQNQGEQ
jgi:hypothetical protein